MCAVQAYDSMGHAAFENMEATGGSPGGQGPFQGAGMQVRSRIRGLPRLLLAFSAALPSLVSPQPNLLQCSFVFQTV